MGFQASRSVFGIGSNLSCATSWLGAGRTVGFASPTVRWFNPASFPPRSSHGSSQVRDRHPQTIGHVREVLQSAPVRPVCALQSQCCPQECGDLAVTRGSMADSDSGRGKRYRSTVPAKGNRPRLLLHSGTPVVCWRQS